MRTDLKTILNRTAAGRQIIEAIEKHERLHGQAVYLGTNIFQNIGKYTHKFTGSLAKIAAGIVGIPPSAIDALAKADPTAHNALNNALQNSPAGKQAANAFSKSGIFAVVKPVYIIAGAAGIAAIIIFTHKKKKGKR